MWMDSSGQNEFHKNKTGMKFKTFFFFFYVYIKKNIPLHKKRLKTKFFSLGLHMDKNNSPGEKIYVFTDGNKRRS